MSMPGPGTDLRLVITDMDGTLLREDGTLPEGFWEMYKHLEARGIPFVPASGRQLFTLERLFEPESSKMSFIAENGNMVTHNSEVVSATVMDMDIVSQVEATVRQIGRDGRDIGLVVCGHKSAYTERTDNRFLQEVRKYYTEVAVVPDMTSIPDKVLKLAIFDFDDAEEARPHFEHFGDRVAVVVSSPNWIDIMDPKVNKGVAVRAMQRALGVTPEQTAAFGDYLNDLEMLESCGLSFAMANAHPAILKTAKYEAPSNLVGGVVTTVEKLLAQSPEADTKIAAEGVSKVDLTPTP